MGVVIAVAVMFLPVHASFADDPLLRLQGFGRDAGPTPTAADCGSALSNLGTPSGGGSLYEVARDRACHDVSQRRAALAFAGGLLLVVLGVAGLVRVEGAEPTAVRPASSSQQSGGRAASIARPVAGRAAPERGAGPAGSDVGERDLAEPEPVLGRSERRRRRKAQRAEELSRPEPEPAAEPEEPGAEAALADPGGSTP